MIKTQLRAGSQGSQAYWTVIATAICTVVIASVRMAAFQAISLLVSISNFGIIIVFLVAIGAMVYHRLHSNIPSHASFSLGPYAGLLVNAAAMISGFVILLVLSLPGSVPVNALTFPWAPVMICGAIVTVSGFYIPQLLFRTRNTGHHGDVTFDTGSTA